MNKRDLEKGKRNLQKRPTKEYLVHLAQIFGMNKRDLEKGKKLEQKRPRKGQKKCTKETY